MLCEAFEHPEMGSCKVGLGTWRALPGTISVGVEIPTVQAAFLTYKYCHRLLCVASRFRFSFFALGKL